MFGKWKKSRTPVFFKVKIMFLSNLNSLLLTNGCTTWIENMRTKPKYVDDVVGNVGLIVTLISSNLSHNIHYLLELANGRKSC